ncbi:hypothetical protein AIOL_003153 [Candidatus Rhodobacter oscarellae]|uniref:Uncharacterized protein n=1 Tax=Candidatus Rhodobacter oscarellae TaxID=1675527 RepID=A0A0J9E672_9RHOB|nr:hypothetical protein [Candidatus Rhodobacter lobularis]KMW58182.1 hypothetical protein AIOL_003153 [Candidatus Rhodobacter lobularis]
MTLDPQEVGSNERETIRLYALDLDKDAVPAFTAPRQAAANGDHPWPLQRALGAAHLEPEHIEVFTDQDLTGLGLAAYLEEGQGIAHEDLNAEMLDAQQGHFVLVHAAAFGGRAQRLDPQAPLRLLGAYRLAPPQPHIDMAAAEPAPLERALPDDIPPPPHSSRSAALVLGVLAVLLVIVLALLIWR